MSLGEVAHRAGISLGYLSQIELGKNTATLEKLFDIAAALQTPLHVLIAEATKGVCERRDQEGLAVV